MSHERYHTASQRFFGVRDLWLTGTASTERYIRALHKRIAACEARLAEDDINERGRGRLRWSIKVTQVELQALEANPQMERKRWTKERESHG